jgi:hypothetical protein
MILQALDGLSPRRNKQPLLAPILIVNILFILSSRQIPLFKQGLVNRAKTDWKSVLRVHARAAAWSRRIAQVGLELRELFLQIGR